jgi:thymidylate synthase (FAD)
MKTANIEVTYINHCGDDLSTVNAARVSFHKESSSFQEQDGKLIRYLAKHKHFSPFNHAFLSFRVKAPIFVARQLVKHKFMPWNEVSRRYVEDGVEFYFPEFWRKRAENVKQGSSNEAFTGYIWHEFASHVAPHLQGGVDIGVEEATAYAIESSLALYAAMIEQGVAPEQARMVLPQNTMTEWIWSGTLGAFCDMLRLRLDPHTQYESRLVAEQIYDKVKQLFPVSVGALLEREVSPT